MGLRVVQAIIDVYYIVVEAWNTGVGWSSLLESRSRWVAIFVWAYFIHIAVWLAGVSVYTFVIYSGRMIRIILAYTPLASVWWGLGGIWWLVNYKRI